MARRNPFGGKKAVPYGPGATPGKPVPPIKGGKGKKKAKKKR